jgi:hypothetical protein
LKLPLPAIGDQDFPIVQYADDTLLILEACPKQLFFLKAILNSFATSTGLKVNYNKSNMYPINLPPEKMEILSRTLNCQIGEMPFTYLGLPLGLAKPRKQHFLPLIQRIEKRLSCSSNFLSQAGRLVLVNSVFSALPTFFMCTLKIPKTIIKQIDIFRRNCLWRRNDLSSKKPPLISWVSVTQRKVNGGLGVLHLETQNEALLIKFLHKFFNNNDLPWVNLIWNNYYLSRGLPGHRNIGSFWWKSMIKLLPNFKGLTHPVIGNGKSISFWDDQWSQNIARQKFPELFSFVKNTKLSIKEAKEQDQFAGFSICLFLSKHMSSIWSCRWLGSKLPSIILTTVGDTFGAPTNILRKNLTSTLWASRRFTLSTDTYGRANASLNIEFSIGCGLRID